MKTIFSHLKPYSIHIVIAYTLTFIELASELLFPLFLGILINEGIMADDMKQIYFWGTVMLFITALTFAAGIVNSFYAAHISVQFAYSLRERLFSHIQRFTFEQLAKIPSSALVTRFTNDVRQVQNTIFMALRIMAKAPFLIFGSVIMALVVNFKIASIFLLTVPLMMLFLYFVLIKGANMFKRVQHYIDRINRIIQENIAGMRTIRSFVRSDFENERFSEANRLLATNTTKAFRFVEMSMPVLLFVMNLAMLFILWFGHFHVVQGATTVGDVVAIINYALRTAMAISLLTFISLAFSRAKASIERIDQVLAERAEEETSGDKYTEAIKGSITFDNVSFRYANANEPTIKNISFNIKEKETVAIIGATGSGKTTLFQLIPKLYEPTEGNIFIDDKPLDEYDIETLRNQIGYVPQKALLFTGTIRDNITFGKRDATEAEMIQAAKDAQIHDAIMAFPNRYNTLVGQKGITLSGGQQQRISIARALIRKPKILLLDDCTSALDLQTEAKLLEAIAKYNCTILMITQKIRTAKRADRIILLDAGKVSAIGTHEQLLQHSTLYQAIVQSQSEDVTYVS